MNVSRNIFVGTSGSAFDPTFNAEELTATHGWLAAVTLNQAGSATHNNESIQTFVDQIGSLNLDYVGPQVPAYVHRPPFLRAVQRDRPYVAFANEPETCFKSAQFALTTYPYAFGMVMEFLPGQSYEGFNDGGNTGDGNAAYAGNLPPGLRMGGSDPAYFGLPNANLGYFTRHLVLFEFTADTLSITIDGVLADSKPNPDPASIDVGLTHISRWYLGVSTNNSVWNCYEMLTWEGAQYTALKADQDNILNSIGIKWNCKSVNPNPHIYHPSDGAEATFTYDQSTGALTPSYTWVNATADQIAAEEVVWIGRYHHTLESGGFYRQQVVSTDKIANYNDIINIPYTPYPGEITDGDTITGLQALYYTVRTPGFDETKGYTYDLPLTSI